MNRKEIAPNRIPDLADLVRKDAPWHYDRSVVVYQLPDGSWVAHETEPLHGLLDGGIVSTYLQPDKLFAFECGTEVDVYGRDHLDVSCSEHALDAWHPRELRSLT